MFRRGILIVFGALLLSALAPVRATAACVPIRTVADLDQIRTNLRGSFCLKNDLDLASVANFVPIGHPIAFGGVFDGGGHVIRNLKIDSDLSTVGLFATVGGGFVRNLNLAGMRVTSTHFRALVGGIAGFVVNGSRISNARVAGLVRCSGKGCRAGGVAGETDDTSGISMTSSAASVVSGNGGAAGGLAGQIEGFVEVSYATGPVACGDNCAVGGLIGWISEGASVARSFASGPVHADKDGDAGGLAGFGAGTVLQSYATGAITAGVQTVGGLIAAKGGRVSEVFAAGHVQAAGGGFTGGLFAALEPPDKPLTSAYWDTDTTGQSTSIGGVGKTTTQLRSAKPVGFGDAWGITKGASYPYLTNANLDFMSTLATLVTGTTIYTFVPIGQLEPTEYAVTPAHADDASLAAVYTMLARAVGVTSNVALLKGVRIDKYFWDDATSTANFAGPVTDHATLGALQAISAAMPLSEANVVGALRSGHMVILRGSYRKQVDRTFVTAQHWLLATLFTNNDHDQLERIVANDPYTGRQVLIGPAIKRVLSPAGFPLANFVVDGYQIVTLN